MKNSLETKKADDKKNYVYQGTRTKGKDVGNVSLYHWATTPCNSCRFILLFIF